MNWFLRVFFALCFLPGWITPALAMEDDDCLGCHAETSIVGDPLTINQVRFDSTPHADLGCTTCHSGVGDDHPDDGQHLGRASCNDCHTDVEAEYAETAHAGNAACVDCHNPHAVKALDEVSGYDMNRPCGGCHDDNLMVTSHKQWLPQTNLHLMALPCITCHTGSEKMVLELYLSKRGSETPVGGFQLATFEELAALTHTSNPAQLIDQNANQIISVDELRSFNSNPDYRNFRLQGLMVPAHKTHSYDILYNRWDCTYCHGTGPSSIQTSYLGFPQSDGSYRRILVENSAVLTVLYTTPDFYMIGSTRNSALNIVGALILAGGLLFPVGHGFMRFLTRKNRKQA